MKQAPLQLIGFWEESEDSPQWPDPKDLVTDTPLTHRERVVAYLRSGVVVAEWLGYSHCRFEGGPSDRVMGCRDLSDGYWLWPEGLWVYIDQFNVKLPNDFLEHVKANDYRVPEGLDRADLSKRRRDDSFWMQWASQAVPKVERPTRRSAYALQRRGVRLMAGKDSDGRVLKPHENVLLGTLLSQTIALAICYARSVTVGSRWELFATPRPTLDPVVIVCLGLGLIAIAIGWLRTARWALLAGITSSLLAVFWLVWARSDSFVGGNGDVLTTDMLVLIDGLVVSDWGLATAVLILAAGLYATTRAHQSRVLCALAISPLLVCAGGCLLSTTLWFKSGFYHGPAYLDGLCLGLVDYLRSIDLTIVLVLGWSILCVVEVFRRQSGSAHHWVLHAAVLATTASMVVLQGHFDRAFGCWQLPPANPVRTWDGADFSSQNVESGCAAGDSLLDVVGQMSRLQSASIDQYGNFLVPPPVCDSGDSRICTVLIQSDSRAPGHALAERARELQQMGYPLVLIAPVLELRYSGHSTLETWPRHCVQGWMTTTAFAAALPRHASWVKFLASGDIESKQLPFEISLE